MDCMRPTTASLILTFLVAGCTPPGSTPRTTNGGVRVGLAAPEIAGQDLDGVSFKLSDYRGKVVMLDFWGDW
jgi:hypothetical protein